MGRIYKLYPPGLLSSKQGKARGRASPKVDSHLRQYWTPCITRSKTMIIDRLILVLYLLVSIAGFWCLRTISIRISGRNLTVGRFWVFFALLMLWVINQMSVAHNGYLFLYRPSKEIFENDYIIRWVAFVSAIVQAFFLPGREEPRRWFSRK